jgi:hypothetical protein
MAYIFKETQITCAFITFSKKFIFGAAMSTQLHDQIATTVYPLQSFSCDQSLNEVKKVVIHAKVCITYNLGTLALL